VDHEGAGVVEAIRSSVTTAKPGHRVLLSYFYCGNCNFCSIGEQTYCRHVSDKNLIGTPGLFETNNGTKAIGKFFGQSSFARLIVVAELCVVNVIGMLLDDELVKCVPMACGLMTGSGVVMKHCRPGDVLLVTGLGAVGMSAIMTAKLPGCKAIIAVDRIQKRLDIAKELGATHVYNSSERQDFTSDIHALDNNERIAVAIKTTGAVLVITSALQTIGSRGKLVLLAIPANLDDEVTVPMADFFLLQKRMEIDYMGGAVA